MRTSLVILVFCLSIQASVGSGKVAWHYGPGVAEWAKSYPDCGKAQQSPIDIKTDEVKYSSQLGRINLFNYDVKPRGLKMHNNGHTVQVDVDGQQYIERGDLRTTYKLLQFHFHWGSKDNGSEHLINQKQYPLELHLVHFAVKYGNVSRAMKQPRGLAVLGFMFEISDTDNEKLTSIINGLGFVKYKDQHTNLAEFAISSILPDALDHYYRYDGSLTTPPCYESVVWTVFRNSINISENQLKKFRTLFSNKQGPTTGGISLVNNFRPVQPLNGRVVYTSDPTEVGGSLELPVDMQTTTPVSMARMLAPVHALSVASYLFILFICTQSTRFAPWWE